MTLTDEMAKLYYEDICMKRIALAGYRLADLIVEIYSPS